MLNCRRTPGVDSDRNLQHRPSCFGSIFFHLLTAKSFSRTFDAVVAPFATDYKYRVQRRAPRCRPNVRVSYKRVRPREPCNTRREQILAEACRIIRPGGSLAIMEMDPSAPGYIKLRKNPVSARVAAVVTYIMHACTTREICTFVCPPLLSVLAPVSLSVRAPPRYCRATVIILTVALALLGDASWPLAAKRGVSIPRCGVLFVPRCLQPLCGAVAV